MASVKTRAKRHALVKKSAWENTLPEYRPDMNFMTYGLKLTNALNEVDEKLRQKYVIAYWKAEGKDVSSFDKISSYYFYSAMAIIYMKVKEVPVPQSYETKLSDAYDEVKRRVELLSVPVEGKLKKVVSVKENINELAKKIAAEIDAAVDNFYLTGEKFNIKEFLVASGASATVCKEIASFYVNSAKELEAARTGKYEQLVEGYSHLPRRKLNAFVAMMESIVEGAMQRAAIKKVMRTPRKRKEKAPSVIASKVVFLKEDESLKLKSIHPEKVVGATQVWVFNTKYRKLFKYEALEGMTLSWKGTTLQNFDPTKSGAKTIRKPELMLPQVIDNTRRRLERLFDDVRGVLAKATGRSNGETIIVRVF